MDKYTREELEEALQVVSSTISRCEKTQPKFAEGTSQHTLLKNRIKAALAREQLYTIIEDNGKGFDPKQVKDNPGFGLNIMRERAWKIGAQIEIISAEGNGSGVRSYGTDHKVSYGENH